MQRAAALVLALVAASPGGAAAGSANVVTVITSPDRAQARLDRGALRAVFMMRMRTWPDGKPVKVFVMPDASDVHLRFCREVLGTYPYILRTGWDRAVFTGTGLSPYTVDTLEEMLRRVRQTPGSIGYAVGESGAPE